MFDRNSRYLGLPVATVVTDGGREVLYVRRRMLPAMSSVTAAAYHVVRDHQRLDQIAAAAYNDPTQFWRICDGNPVLDPFDLVDPPGRTLTIPPVRATPVRTGSG
jgi:hypothetical protein